MPHLLTTNANFIPGSPRDVFLDTERSALRWDMEQLNEVADAAGYDGIELHDSNLFAHNRQLHRASPEEAQKIGRMIVTVHESWVDTADPQPRNGSLARTQQKAGLAMRVGSRVIFPRGPKSLDNLETLESKLGRELDYVMFPDIHGDASVDRQKVARFPRSAIQPTIDVAAAWGIDSPQGFADELEERKLMAVWDHFHGDRRGKVVDARMKQEDYLPVLLERGLVRAVHLGLYRTDFKNIDPERYVASVEEGTALKNNSDFLYMHPVGETFGMLRSYNWQGNVTIEAPLGGIEEAQADIDLIPRKFTQAEILERHLAIGHTVRQQLPQIEWQPAAA